MLALKVWTPVQVLAFPKLREANTAPVVGEMVRVVLPAVTEETALPATVQSVLPEPELSAQVMPLPVKLTVVLWVRPTASSIIVA